MTGEPNVRLVLVTRQPTHAFDCRNLETGVRAIVLTTPVRRLRGESIRRFLMRARTKLREMVL